MLGGNLGFLLYGDVSVMDIVGDIRAVSRENLSSGFPTRSDTNRAIQPQKMVEDLKFRISEDV